MLCVVQCMLRWLARKLINCVVRDFDIHMYICKSKKCNICEKGNRHAEKHIHVYIHTYIPALVKKIDQNTPEKEALVVVGSRGDINLRLPYILYALLYALPVVATLTKLLLEVFPPLPN